MDSVSMRCATPEAAAVASHGGAHHVHAPAQGVAHAASPFATGDDDDDVLLDLVGGGFSLAELPGSCDGLADLDGLLDGPMGFCGEVGFPAALAAASASAPGGTPRSSGGGGTKAGGGGGRGMMRARGGVAKRTSVDTKRGGSVDLRRGSVDVACTLAAVLAE
eukprot:79989-Chlamydomonas_euryale.AAC.3